MKYCLVRDNSSHWYVIPTDHSEEWWRIMETEPNEAPDWADRVNGSACMVSFDSYCINGVRVCD